MFIIYNNIGVLMAMVAIGPSIYFFDSPAVAGGIGIAVDLVYRIITRNEGDSLLIMFFGPKNGGQFFFLPVWVWGFGLLLWG